MSVFVEVPPKDLRRCIPSWCAWLTYRWEASFPGYAVAAPVGRGS